MDEPRDDELQALRMKRLRQIIADDSLAQERPPWPGGVITVTDANLQEVLNHYPLVVVDCWAPWCGPCRTLAPVIDTLAAEYHGKVVFAKLNVDENQRTAMMYQTMSIPTLLIFRQGKPVDRITGAVPKPMIQRKIQPLLGTHD